MADSHEHMAELRIEVEPEKAGTCFGYNELGEFRFANSDSDLERDTYVVQRSIRDALSVLTPSVCTHLLKLEIELSAAEPHEFAIPSSWRALTRLQHLRLMAGCRVDGTSTLCSLAQLTELILHQTPSIAFLPHLTNLVSSTIFMCRDSAQQALEAAAVAKGWDCKQRGEGSWGNTQLVTSTMSTSHHTRPHPMNRCPITSLTLFDAPYHALYTPISNLTRLTHLMLNTLGPYQQPPSPAPRATGLPAPLPLSSLVRLLSLELHSVRFESPLLHILATLTQLTSLVVLDCDLRLSPPLHPLHPPNDTDSDDLKPLSSVPPSPVPNPPLSWGAGHWRQLQALKIRESEIPADALWSLFDGCRQLVTLELDAERLDALLAMKLVGSCTELEEVTLSGCDRLTDVGVASLGRLPRLRVLSLEGCGGVTEMGVVGMMACRPPQLAEVQFCWCECLNAGSPATVLRVLSNVGVVYPPDMLRVV